MDVYYSGKETFSKPLTSGPTTPTNGTNQSVQNTALTMTPIALLTMINDVSPTKATP